MITMIIDNFDTKLNIECYILRISNINYKIILILILYFEEKHQ
jgi:hypothetical protein